MLNTVRGWFGKSKNNPEDANKNPEASPQTAIQTDTNVQDKKDEQPNVDQVTTTKVMSQLGTAPEEKAPDEGDNSPDEIFDDAPRELSKDALAGFLKLLDDKRKVFTDDLKDWWYVKKDVFYEGTSVVETRNKNYFKKLSVWEEIKEFFLPAQKELSVVLANALSTIDKLTDHSNRLRNLLKTQYQLCLMSDNQPVEPNTLYLKKEGDLLEYAVIAPSGKTERGFLTEAQIKCKITDPLNLQELSQHMSDILQVTSARGHTAPEKSHKERHDIFVKICDTNMIILNQLIDLLDNTRDEIRECIQFERKGIQALEKAIQIAIEFFSGFPCPSFHFNVDETYRNNLNNRIANVGTRIILSTSTIEAEVERAKEDVLKEKRELDGQTVDKAIKPQTNDSAFFQPKSAADNVVQPVKQAQNGLTR